MDKIRCVNCMEEITGTICPHCGYKEGDTEQTGYGLKRNSIIHGRYLIGNVLGQGGFGITYIGFDIALEIKVAIKEYFPMGYVSRDYTHSNQIVWNTMSQGQEQWKKGSENFLKEARRMAKIDVLPEIVRVRDTFMENNTSYIVMDYVEGETLKAWLLKNGTMKFSDCVKMLSPLMQSLNRVHKRGLIHRDISPDNIMLLPDGEVRLLDLGAAKDLSIESNGTSQLVTKKGFSPSEQYMENGSIGTWTDVYALSATIYYSITGKPVPEAMDRLMGDTLTFDVPLREALSKEAVETLKKGLAIKAEDRIQTVEELEQKLQKAIQLKKENEIKQEETAQKAETIKKKKEAVQEKQKAAKEIYVNKEAAATADKVLMKDFFSTTVLGSEINRTRIVSVTFTDTLNEMSDNAWDVSLTRNGSVMAWTIQNGEMYDLYIGGAGGVKGSDCIGLFADYLNAKKIDFNNCFDASHVTGMSGMFLGCKNLLELNVSGFDTSNVKDMYAMFCACKDLTELNVKSFDTSNVTDMTYMFGGCENLTKLDVSSFDISNVTDMNGMFYYCGVTAEEAGLKIS